jgi:hypothetical protein
MKPIEKVVEWVNKDKPLWWRHAIRLALQHGELNNDHLDSLCTMAQMEFKLLDQDEQYKINAMPVIATGYGHEDDPVNLLSIGNVKNVFALVENEELTFSQTGMTVVYGDNGAGKSSYAKILKTACLTRGDVPHIMTNIFNPSTATSEAALTIKVGNSAPQNLQWQKESLPIEELKSIRVFDSHSATHYVTKEDNINYKPAEIRLVDELTKACQSIKEITAQEAQKNNNPFIVPNLTVGTKANTFLQNLTLITTIDEIDSHSVRPEELKNQDNIRIELNEIVSKTPAQLKLLYAKKHKYLEPIYKALTQLCDQLSDEKIKNIGVLYDDLKTKKLAAENIRKQTLDNLPIQGVGAEPWKKMWQYVEMFVTSNGQNKAFPPVLGDNCPTCLQPIQQDAALRLAGFHAYMNDQSQVQVRKSQIDYDNSMQFIKNLNFDLTPHNAVLHELSISKPDVIKSLLELSSQLQLRKDNTLSATPLFINAPLILKVPNWLNSQIKSFKQKEQSVQDDGSLTKLCDSLKLQISEIEDRQKVTDNKKNIIGEINRRGYLHSLNEIITSTNLSRITRLTSELSDNGSLASINKQFNQELKKLGFKSFKVKTNTRGSVGQQKFKLMLSGQSSLISHIASEGELKCIALAGFLAELTIDNRHSTIIFDDPVSSLDHKWRRLFAERIALEAQTRQVIVLTHDLPFFMLLSEASENNITVRSINKRGSLSGYPKDTLPWDAMKTDKRIKKLKQLILDLNKYCQGPEFDQDDYNDKAKSIYSKKRDTWEHLVEEWLIRKVVQRFGRDVRTSNIRYLVDNTPEDVKIINDAMTKCSKFCGAHNTATALGVVDMPDIDELEGDITKLEVYFKTLKSRKIKLD